MFCDSFRAFLNVRSETDMNILTTLKTYDQLVTCFGSYAVNIASKNPRTKLGVINEPNTFDYKFFYSIQAFLVKQGILRYQTDNN